MFSRVFLWIALGSIALAKTSPLVEVEDEASSSESGFILNDFPLCSKFLYEEALMGPTTSTSWVDVCFIEKIKLDQDECPVETNRTNRSLESNKNSCSDSLYEDFLTVSNTVMDSQTCTCPSWLASSNLSKGSETKLIFSLESTETDQTTLEDIMMTTIHRWRNQLGSEVEFHITLDDKTQQGLLTGTYRTQVSSNGDPLPGKPLHGTVQVTPQGHFLLGWSVQWQVPSKENPKEIRYSTTSWSGLIRSDQSDQLETTWLLTSSDEPAWKSTNIGKDTYVRL